jgi:hypothetical protein
MQMSAYAHNSAVRNVSSVMSEHSPENTKGAGSAILGGGSLAAAGIEAICTFFVTLSKLGVLAGFTALLSELIASKFHANIVRVPVLGLATAGAMLNLVVLWNRMRLRNAPAAAWRKRPLRRRERWKIGLVIAMSVMTIGLVIGEFVIHPFHGF